MKSPGAPAFPAWLARTTVLLVCLGVLFVLVLLRYRASPAEFDDAYISFRYAQQLVEGHGLVFNVEDGRVEGFTNLAWVLLTAGAMKLGYQPMDFCSTAGLLALALSLALALGSFRLDGPLSAIRFGGALAVLAVPNLISVAGSGLETSFAGLLAVGLGVVLLAEKPSLGWFAIISLLLAATRPDGALFVGAAALAASLPRRLPRRGEWRDAARPVIAFGAVSAAIVLGLFAFRLAYFGELVPNTYFAKNADMSHWAAGLEYLTVFARSAPQVPTMLAIWVFGAFVLRRPTRLDVYGLIAVTLYCVYVAKVGGDFMSYRFAFQVLPLIFFLWCGSLEQPGWARALALGVAGLVALCAGAFRPEVMELEYGMQSVETMNSFVAPGRRVGLALRDALPATARTSTTLAGAVPYYSQLFTVDEWGLNDKEVARMPSKPIGKASRGHLKKAPDAYLDKRGVNFEIGHPTICDCARRCDENRPNVYLRLDGGKDCVRMRYRAQTPELTRLVCSSGKFIVNNVDCRPAPMPTFSFEPTNEPAAAAETLEQRPLSNSALLASARGIAFGRTSQRKALDGQTAVSGALDFINGFHGGDMATGWIDVPLPTGTRRVDLLLGGGKASDTLFVGIVDGSRVLERVGGDETEVLKPKALTVPSSAVAPRLVVYDKATAGWGHLLLADVRVQVANPAAAATP